MGDDTLVPKVFLDFSPLEIREPRSGDRKIKKNLWDQGRGMRKVRRPRPSPILSFLFLGETRSVKGNTIEM